MVNCQFWKPIIGYEDCYLISDQGNVRRIKKARAYTFVGKILKPEIMKAGYERITLCDNRVLTRVMVHHLVMSNFIGPCYPNWVVNHKDGIKTNNSLYNLEYVTGSENCIHAIKSGKVKTVGETHHDAKLDRKKVEEIKELYKTTKISQRKLAKIYGVSKCAIQNVLNGKTWKVY